MDYSEKWVRTGLPAPTCATNAGNAVIAPYDDMKALEIGGIIFDAIYKQLSDQT